MYTSHGHQIPGTPEEGVRPPVARCGGPSLCSVCGTEASKQQAGELPDPAKKQSPILRYFVYDHLPEHLRNVSKDFAILAWSIEGTLPEGPEKSTALRKLLESKDAAVRAALDIKT